MEYSIAALAKLAHVSTRTLRYYDEIGLLKPLRKTGAGYRVYGPREVERLQQILFFRSLQMELETVRVLVDGGDPVAAMEAQIDRLKREKDALEDLIAYAETSVRSMKGEQEMSDREKFARYKANRVRENEEKYGAEARTKYGSAAVDETNSRILSAEEKELSAADALAEEILRKLAAAMEEGDPAGAKAREVCELHTKWLGFYWKTVTDDAHLALCRMYTEDERFRAYYDRAAPGAADFLLAAMTRCTAKE